jgi:DNA-binding transcriptional ArsR family regulator
MSDHLTYLLDHQMPGAWMMESVDLTIGRPISEAKADLFRALAHPARIRALEVLAEGEVSVGALQPLVGIESSYLSQQLGILRRSGLVTARKDGSQVFYSVADPQLIELLGVAKRVLIRSLSNTEDLLANLRAELAEAE